MPQLHETVMGQRLIQYTLPEIAEQLKRVADALENKNVDTIRLKERYKTLSELDADPKSTHHMNRKVLAEMDKTLAQLKNL